MCSRRFWAVYSVCPYDWGCPGAKDSPIELLPIIREPHWTSWKVNDVPDKVRIGTRDHQGEGYLLVINQTSQTQTVDLKLDGLTYSPKEARDYFTDEPIASVRNGSLSVTLPAIGIASGTKVLRLVREEY